jgi:NTE family protein
MLAASSTAATAPTRAQPGTSTTLTRNGTEPGLAIPFHYSIPFHAQAIRQLSMNANIVLAGGGAKGAVLGGCLLAVEEAQIKPVGFGGTSAGSIVATLASLRYSGDELRCELIDKDLSSFLDDDGKKLDELKAAWNLFSERLGARSILTPCSMRSLAAFFKARLGLYDGKNLKNFLADAIRRKLPDLPYEAEKVTFDQLVQCGCLPLKIVATDFQRRRAVVFGAGGKGAHHSVVDAVLASASFPFVFKPVQLDNMLLTDGGLSSNLPAFLFDREYRESRTPTLAFDLVPPEAVDETAIVKPDLGEFARSLLSSSLEASDVLLRDATPGVGYFAIKTPLGIGTLDFSLDKPQRESCFDKGFSEAALLLRRYEPIRRAREFGDELQKRMLAQFGPVRLYLPVLRALVEQLIAVSKGQVSNPRAHIMLLTGKSTARTASTRIVTYSIGMDKDADVDMELDQDGGCSGTAWEQGRVAVADLDAARTDPTIWKMSIQQHNKVPERVRSMISIPIPGNVHAESAPNRPVGTLSVDCETPLVNTGWCTDGHEMSGSRPDDQPEIEADVLTLMNAWATVVGAMLP